MLRVWSAENGDLVCRLVTSGERVRSLCGLDIGGADLGAVISVLNSQEKEISDLRARVPDPDSNPALLRVVHRLIDLLALEKTEKIT